MSNRPFRGEESLRFEEMARDAVVPFLKGRGFLVSEDRRVVTGTATSQIVSARLPSGQRAVIRVRLCWRRDGRNPREQLYSAAQLRARRLEAGWAETLRDIERKNVEQGVTHLLLYQRDTSTETHAALVPVGQVGPIWRRQFEVSARLIAAGQLGRMSKNHAANGHSPTLWLQDDRVPAARAVADVLWSWPGVIDVMVLPLIRSDQASMDDTYDDLPGRSSDIGSDGGDRYLVVRSAVRRDAKVRAAVRARANGVCERCGESRGFEGFLDVHHIMGVEKSDRPYTCVALCPNCHRETHLSPDAELISIQLSAFAAKFKPAPGH